MNFLGHLYFSDNDTELMYANLYGDFVKGSDLSHFSDDIRKGIKLHRAIDNYIDHHEDVVKLMHHLYPSLPKVTGVAIDLYFDHLLAANWSNFHQLPYRQFLDRFYNYSIDNNPNYPDSFKTFIETLKSNDWMIHYSSREGLSKMCFGVSQRISFANSLSKADLVFDHNFEFIFETFVKYMHTAIPYFKDYRASL